MVDIGAIRNDARYSRREASTILGITPRTIDRWSRQGKVRTRYSKTNGRPFFLGIDLRKAIAEI